MDNHENAQLEQGKKILESLGYNVEMGARHLNVLISDEMADEEMEALQIELSAKSGVEVWVMQENIIIDIADNMHLLEAE